MDVYELYKKDTENTFRRIVLRDETLEKEFNSDLFWSDTDKFLNELNKIKQ